MGPEPIVVVTSREFLYHLPCESSARKLDRFGSGWMAPEPAVRTDRVVVRSPALRHDLCFVERIEQFAVQKLPPHLCSVIPSFRQASSTVSPLPVSSSTVRRCCRISSGVDRFLGMILTSWLRSSLSFTLDQIFPGRSFVPLDQF